MIRCPSLSEESEDSDSDFESSDRLNSASNPATYPASSSGFPPEYTEILNESEQLPQWSQHGYRVASVPREPPVSSPPASSASFASLASLGSLGFPVRPSWSRRSSAGGSASTLATDSASISATSSSTDSTSTTHSATIAALQALSASSARDNYHNLPINPQISAKIAMQISIDSPNSSKPRKLSPLAEVTNGDLLTGSVTVTNQSSMPVPFGDFTVSLRGVVSSEGTHKSNRVVREFGFLHVFDHNACFPFGTEQSESDSTTDSTISHIGDDNYTPHALSSAVQAGNHTGQSVSPRITAHLPSNRILPPKSSFVVPFRFVIPLQLLESACPCGILHHQRLPPSYGVPCTLFSTIQKQKYPPNPALGYLCSGEPGSLVITEDKAIPEAAVSYTVDAVLTERPNGSETPKKAIRISKYNLRVRPAPDVALEAALASERVSRAADDAQKLADWLQSCRMYLRGSSEPSNCHKQQGPSEKLGEFAVLTEEPGRVPHSVIRQPQSTQFGQNGDETVESFRLARGGLFKTSVPGPAVSFRLGSVIGPLYARRPKLMEKATTASDSLAAPLPSPIVPLTVEICGGDVAQLPGTVKYSVALVAHDLRTRTSTPILYNHEMLKPEGVVAQLVATVNRKELRDLNEGENRDACKYFRQAVLRHINMPLTSDEAQLDWEKPQEAQQDFRAKIGIPIEVNRLKMLLPSFQICSLTRVYGLQVTVALDGWYFVDSSGKQRRKAVLEVPVDVLVPN